LRFKRLGLRFDRTERTTLPLLILACAIVNALTRLVARVPSSVRRRRSRQTA